MSGDGELGEIRGGAVAGVGDRGERLVGVQELDAVDAVVAGGSPNGFAALIDRLASAFGAGLRDALPMVIREVEPGGRIALSTPCEIEAAKVPHTAESVAYSVSARGRRGLRRAELRARGRALAPAPSGRPRRWQTGSAFSA